MQATHYQCTALKGTNKQGIIKPNEDGYYEVVLGALNFYNSAGAYYTYEGSKHLFESSSTLMRRVESGALRGEYGHPKKQPGMGYRDFVQRIIEIHEENVSHHIRSIRIDHDSIKDKNGQSVIAIIGEVKPCGPKGDALRESLENPNECVSFSIRSITNDVPVRGVLTKTLKTVVTWDYVNEPGIEVAKKWNAPSLESNEEIIITAENLGNVLDFQRKMGIGLESGSLSAEEIFNDLGWELPKAGGKAPNSLDW